MNRSGGNATDGSSAPLDQPGRTRKERAIHALGDPVNRELLAVMNDQPRSVQELLAQVSVPKSSVYNRLHVLRELGLVAVQRTIITSDGKRTDLFRSLVEEARIEVHGSETTLSLRLRNLPEERLTDLFRDMHQEAGR